MKWYRIFSYGPGTRPDYAQLTDAQYEQAVGFARRGRESSAWDLCPMTEAEVIVQCQILGRGDVLSHRRVTDLLNILAERYDLVSSDP